MWFDLAARDLGTKSHIPIVTRVFRRHMQPGVLTDGCIDLIKIVYLPTSLKQGLGYDGDQSS